VRAQVSQVADHRKVLVKKACSAARNLRQNHRDPLQSLSAPCHHVLPPCTTTCHRQACTTTCHRQACIFFYHHVLPHATGRQRADWLLPCPPCPAVPGRPGSLMPYSLRTPMDSCWHFPGVQLVGPLCTLATGVSSTKAGATASHSDACN